MAMGIGSALAGGSNGGGFSGFMKGAATGIEKEAKNRLMQSGPAQVFQAMRTPQPQAPPTNAGVPADNTYQDFPDQPPAPQPGPGHLAQLIRVLGHHSKMMDGG